MLTDYDILRIPETKDISTIRKAYRKIVKEIHPSQWTFETKRTLNKPSPLRGGVGPNQGQGQKSGEIVPQGILLLQYCGE